MESEREKVQQSQEAAKDALSRAADLREEVAALRGSHQRQLEVLRSDVARELTGRQQAVRRAEEAEAEVGRQKSALEMLKRSAAIEEAQLRSASAAAVRELESSRSASMETLSQVEERLARAMVRAEAAEEELDAANKSLQGARQGEAALRAQLEELRLSQGRELASKTQTIESLRDALAASEEMLAQERRALATAKEEGRWREEALQREVDALTAAKERAAGEAKRVRDGADAAAEGNGKRVLMLEAQLQESSANLLKTGREAAALDEECSRLRGKLDALSGESQATVQKLTAQVAQMKAANESQLKLLDTKELDFAHAQAALKRRVEALEHQRAAEGERTRRIEEDKRRLEDGMAHSSSQVEALREEVADLQQARDSLARQVKTYKAEAAAASKEAENTQRAGMLAQDALQSQLSIADQDRESNEKRLQMQIDEATLARSSAEGEARTLRGEVAALNQIVQDLQRENKRNQEVIARMEKDVDEAGGQRAQLMQARTELEATQQRVQALREEKAQTALAHEKDLRFACALYFDLLVC